MSALPAGWGLAFDRSLLRYRDGTVLAGGHPGRVITVTRTGAVALEELVAGGRAAPGTISVTATAELAGRLVEAGMAHPRPPAPRTATGDGGTAGIGVTVVVPVRDRPGALDRCLASIDPRLPVVVVDDASRNPAAVARVCEARGARLLTRSVNGGPAAARNDALEAVTTAFVAFVDSDCTVPPGWLEGLIWLFDDAAIGAVAPRVRPAEPRTAATRTIHRFNRSHSSLDLGPHEGEVGPDRAVRYVPTAALVARHTALDDVGGFDPALRVGEDVDLVWRLSDAGWRVRYVPAVTVHHAEPEQWGALLARRARYGTSAARLDSRHPGRLAPVELRPWSAAAAVGGLAGRPGVATAAVATSAVLLSRQVRPLGIPAGRAWRWSITGAGWSVIGLGRAATMVHPAVLAVLATRGRRARRAAIILALAPAVVEWVRTRPDLDLPRWVVASLADDVAYSVGVLAGCLWTGRFGPLVPAVVRAGGGT